MAGLAGWGGDKVDSLTGRLNFSLICRNLRVVSLVQVEQTFTDTMMYNHSCEYCEGTVKERIIAREVFKHKKGFVMLENVPIGICDHCGYRYYHASIIKKVDDIAEGRQPAEAESIPVAEVG